MPASWFGYRWVAAEPLGIGTDTNEPLPSGLRIDVVHRESVSRNGLPRNVSDLHQLPDDRGWWGYSMRDVPTRNNAPTFVLRLRGARVLWYTEAETAAFHPAVLTPDDRSLDLREMRFRRGHAEVLRRSVPAVRMPRATWILERVYDNHSHWLTAHLPKLLLLRERGGLGDVVLPPVLTPTMESSLRLLDLDPAAFARFDPERPLLVDELTVVGTDRFRPELLRSVQRTFAGDAGPGRRRIYISRARAQRRRLVNEEDEIWPLLASAGFERVFMEDLSFEQQVRLMGETGVLFAPHGAGLTNMVLSPPGIEVVEIADLSFPNPNFYALACAVGHGYWLLSGDSVGDAHPLERDLRIDPAAVGEVLAQLPG